MKNKEDFFLIYQIRKSVIIIWEKNSFLAYQIRKSMMFTWNRDSHLTHVIITRGSSDKIHAGNWSVPNNAKVSASFCLHENV